MSIVATMIWIAIGILYVAHKGFLEVIGSQILSFLCVVLCAVGVFFVAAAGHYSDSMTIAFMAAAGLVELLAFVLSRQNSENGNLCQPVSVFLLPLTALLGVIEMLNDEKFWLMLVIIPSVLYSIVKVKEIINVYSRWREDEVQQRIDPAEHKEADHDNKGF